VRSKNTHILTALIGLAFLVGFATESVVAQDDLVLRPKSGIKAFGLSLLVPGLGHRYVNGGRWGGAGTIFVAADLTL